MKARRWCGWAVGLKALIEGDTPKALNEFDACRAELPRIGGSRAQRGIVEGTWGALRLPVPGDSPMHADGSR